MIGATGRNSGKTKLVTRLIEIFSKKYPITGLKVSTYYGNDEQFHGQNQEHLKENFLVIKDTDISTEKNTAKMLAAGASEVFWIKTNINSIDASVNKFLKQKKNNTYIVCESNSLRKSLIPDVFIMIRNTTKPLKNSAEDVMKYADIIIESNGKEFSNFDVSSITIENGKWIIKIN
jgi:uridine kinase